MRYTALFFWAVASFIAIHDGRPLSPRQMVQSSSTQQSIASSFTQVTESYSSISQSFVETRQSLQSTTSIEECSSILTEFTNQISDAVQAISGGCDCAVDGVDTNSLQTMISTWFIELQTMAQYVQSRFPNRYQSYFGSTFSRISTHVELALGVAYSAGVNIDNVVQGAVQQSNINPTVLSNLNIQTSRFTQISQSVSTRIGIFANVAPGGRRFPDRPFIPRPVTATQTQGRQGYHHRYPYKPSPGSPDFSTSPHDFRHNTPYSPNSPFRGGPDRLPYKSPTRVSASPYDMRTPLAPNRGNSFHTGSDRVGAGSGLSPYDQHHSFLPTSPYQSASQNHSPFATTGSPHLPSSPSQIHSPFEATGLSSQNRSPFPTTGSSHLPTYPSQNHYSPFEKTGSSTQNRSPFETASHMSTPSYQPATQNHPTFSGPTHSSSGAPSPFSHPNHPHGAP